MKQWQKDRNYRIRKIVNAEGEVVRREYFITVDGADVEVSREIYEAYSQGDRRERYQAERDEGRLLSIERMEEELNDSMLSRFGDRSAESAEDIAIARMLTADVVSAFEQLEPDERDLVQALVIDGVTEREYAERIGVSQKGVNKRRKKFLEKMRGILVLKQPDFREGK